MSNTAAASCVSLSVLLWLVGCSDNPEAQARRVDKRAIELCKEEQKKHPNLALAADTCKQMEADFQRRWNRAP